MKNIYRIVCVLLLGILTQAMSCEEEPSYLVSEEGIPQYLYLTTISADYFQKSIASHGWKWQHSSIIEEGGTLASYSPTSGSDIIPSDYYFTTDSMTVFLYGHDSNLRRTDTYTYDAANNRVLSNAVSYMQLTYADSIHIVIIERLGEHYYISDYERMLPYEVNARWNGSKPEDNE